MQALHSSSALCCNFFDHWRDRDASALADILGVTAPLQIEFERKYSTGLRGKAPNLDVVVRPTSGPVVAIECKFLEPYGPHGPGFKDKYFNTSSGFWDTAGFPLCQGLSQALYSGKRTFKWLYAEQLLKHVLGLARSGTGWRLLYLWYEVPGPTGIQHAMEIDQFTQVLTEDGIDFGALSYQAVFRELRKKTGSIDRAYVDYVGQRNFAELKWDGKSYQCDRRSVTGPLFLQFINLCVWPSLDLKNCRQAAVGNTNRRGISYHGIRGPKSKVVL
jgi:hypothetical protein